MKKFTVRFLKMVKKMFCLSGTVLRVLDEGDETGTLSFTVDGFLTRTGRFAGSHQYS